MELAPSRSDQIAPTWAHAYGLLSFQISGVLANSLLGALLPQAGGVASSAIITVCAAILYAMYAESNTPGGLAHERHRVLLAFRASFILSLLGIASVFGYVGIKPSSYVIDERFFFLLAVGLILTFGVMWLGLIIGAKYMTRKRMRRQRYAGGEGVA